MTISVNQQGIQRRKSLFDISEDIRLLEESLEVAEDIQQEEIIQDFLDDAQGELEVKLDNYAEFLKEREARAAALKKRAKEMVELADSEAKLCDRLKKNLDWFLQENDIRKVETDRHKITICKNGGKLPIGFTDLPPEQMPERFQEVKVDVNVEAVREALEAGEVLGFAALGERGTHIRIK